MRFADPQACPDCRGAITGQPACPHCGLDLTSVEVRQLWQVLLQADELLARAAQRRVRPATPPATPPPATPPAATPPPPPVTPPPVTPQPPLSDPFSQSVPSYPAPAASQGRPPKDRSWSVGTILLVLGAFGLVVAGLIFVTRSWEDIGLAGRTLILLGVTAVMGALGVWVTRRPLRASAEAVWTVFLALLTLDFFAARHEDLLGLGALEVAASWTVWGAVALALCLGIAVWARPHVKAALVAPAVAGGVAITIAGIGAGAVGDDLDFAWRAIVALVVAGLLALATRPAALAPMTLVARIVFAGFFVAAYVAALVELLDHPAIDDLVAGGHGIPMVMMAIASVVVAWLVPVVRIAATALAVVAISAVIITPFGDADTEEPAWVAVAVLAAILAAAGARGTDAWMRGVRVGAVPVVGGVVVLQLGLLADVAETVERIMDDPWQAAWDARLDALVVENHAAWAVPLVVAGFLVAAWFVPRWPELTDVRPHAALVMSTAVGLSAAAAVVAWRLPVWAIAAALLGLAVVALTLQLLGRVTTLGPAALIVVVAAALLASASHGTSVVAWLVGAATLAGLAYAEGPALTRQAHAVVATGLTLAGTAALVELIEVDDVVTPLVVLVVALGLVAVAGLLLAQHPVRVPLEATAGAGALIALLVPGDTTQVAVRWTILGAVLIALAFAASGRRWYAWPGIASLVVAYVLLIVDSGFSFVEAYTLPLGAVALAIGLYLARRKPTTGTWVLLGPGLAIAMLPSVPQALVDPTELRALLLGVGAVLVLGVGVRLGWQAPFVAGATILTLLVLFNIGPYANAAPRVVLIAGVSAVLLGVGITWEDRVRDGRKIVGYVRAMR